MVYYDPDEIDTDAADPPGPIPAVASCVPVVREPIFPAVSWRRTFPAVLHPYATLKIINGDSRFAGT